MVFYYRRKVDCPLSEREDFIFEGDEIVASYKNSVLRINKKMNDNTEFTRWLDGLIGNTKQDFNYRFLKLFRAYLK